MESFVCDIMSQKRKEPVGNLCFVAFQNILCANSFFIMLGLHLAKYTITFMTAYYFGKPPIKSFLHSTFNIFCLFYKNFYNISIKIWYNISFLCYKKYLYTSHNILSSKHLQYAFITLKTRQGIDLLIKTETVVEWLTFVMRWILRLFAQI